MLLIRPAAPDVVQRLCGKAEIPYHPGIMACQAVDDGREAGFVLYQAEGQLLTLLLADSPLPLLDGLLRAAINRGAIAGLARFCIAPSMAGWASQLAGLGYPTLGQEQDIEAFFARGCGQNRQA